VPRGGASSRETILNAAARLLLRDPSKLTLDAVAAEAGVSKGGLLYHFRSKGDLLDAVVDRWEETFEDEIAAAADPTPGGWTRAYADVIAKDGLDPHAREVDSGIVAAMVLNPDRLEKVRARYRSWQERLAQDGIDEVDATLVRMAAEGLWFCELLDLGPPSGELREKLLERMRALTRASDPLT
jgi:AcrR family transcriptional regulator